MLSGQAEVSRGWTDTPSASDSAETDRMSHGDSAGTYLGVGGAKRSVDETDRVRSHTDTLSGHIDVLSVEMDANETVNTIENVRTERKRNRQTHLLRLPQGSAQTVQAVSKTARTGRACTRTCMALERTPKQLRTCRRMSEHVKSNRRSKTHLTCSS